MRSVFISSTFKDMQAERDYLHTVVFPKIRRNIREYGEDVEDLDLRWGVDTSNVSEEKSGEMVIRVCIDAIDRCVPFVIVLLGTRYGWIPEQKSMKEFQDDRVTRCLQPSMSITGLEIQYGALDTEEKRKHAIVCFRDEGLLNVIPKEKRGEYAPESSFHEEKLNELKAQLRGLDEITIVDYQATWDFEKQCVSGLEAFGQEIERILTEKLISEFGGKPVTDLDRVFTTLRYKQEKLLSSYINRQIVQGSCLSTYRIHEKLHQLRAVWCYGTDGVGKSSLLISLYQNLIHEEQKVMYFDCGSQLCQDMDMFFQVFWNLMRMYSEIDKKDDIPDDIFAELPLEWKKKVSLNVYASISGSYYFLIDHFEQFPVRDQRELMGVFKEIKKNNAYLCVMSSNRPSQRSHSYQKKGWEACDNLEHWSRISFERKKQIYLRRITLPDHEDQAVWINENQIFEVKDISECQAMQMISLTAHKRGKTIDPLVRGVILQKKNHCNPQYLTLVLQRLFMMSQEDYQKADAIANGMEGISRYMQQLVQTMPDEDEELFRESLKAACKAISEQKQIQLMMALQMIAISPRGLTIPELQLVLDGALLPVELERLFSYLYESVEENRGGRWNYCYENFRKCIREGSGEQKCEQAQTLWDKLHNQENISLDVLMEIATVGKLDCMGDELELRLERGTLNKDSFQLWITTFVIKGDGEYICSLVNSERLRLLETIVRLVPEHNNIWIQIGECLVNRLFELQEDIKDSRLRFWVLGAILELAFYHYKKKIYRRNVLLIMNDVYKKLENPTQEERELLHNYLRSLLLYYLQDEELFAAFATLAAEKSPNDTEQDYLSDVTFMKLLKAYDQDQTGENLQPLVNWIRALDTINKKPDSCSYLLDINEQTVFMKQRILYPLIRRKAEKLVKEYLKDCYDYYKSQYIDAPSYKTAGDYSEILKLAYFAAKPERKKKVLYQSEDLLLWLKENCCCALFEIEHGYNLKRYYYISGNTLDAVIAEDFMRMIEEKYQIENCDLLFDGNYGIAKLLIEEGGHAYYNNIEEYWEKMESGLLLFKGSELETVKRMRDRLCLQFFCDTKQTEQIPAVLDILKQPLPNVDSLTYTWEKLNYLRITFLSQKAFYILQEYEKALTMGEKYLSVMEKMEASKEFTTAQVNVLCMNECLKYQIQKKDVSLGNIQDAIFEGYDLLKTVQITEKEAHKILIPYRFFLARKNAMATYSEWINLSKYCEMVRLSGYQDWKKVFPEEDVLITWIYIYSMFEKEKYRTENVQDNGVMNALSLVENIVKNTRENNLYYRPLVLKNLVKWYMASYILWNSRMEKELLSFIKPALEKKKQIESLTETEQRCMEKIETYESKFENVITQEEETISVSQKKWDFQKIREEVDLYCQKLILKGVIEGKQRKTELEKLKKYLFSVGTVEEQREFIPLYHATALKITSPENIQGIYYIDVTAIGMIASVRGSKDVPQNLLLFGLHTYQNMIQKWQSYDPKPQFGGSLADAFNDYTNIASKLYELTKEKQYIESVKEAGEAFRRALPKKEGVDLDYRFRKNNSYFIELEARSQLSESDITEEVVNDFIELSHVIMKSPIFLNQLKLDEMMTCVYTFADHSGYRYLQIRDLEDEFAKYYTMENKKTAFSKKPKIKMDYQMKRADQIGTFAFLKEIFSEEKNENKT